MIHGYHDGRSYDDTLRPSLMFHRVNRHGEITSVSPALAGALLHIGFECENDGYRTMSVAVNASDVVDSMRGDYCHCERDGSLGNGFEVVSNPMTLAAHRAAHWDELLNKLSELGGQGHDSRNAGLHFHVSRAALGNDDHDKYLCIAKMLELMERFQQNFSCIARRDIAYCGWCKPTEYGHKVTDSSRAMIRKAKAVQSWQGIGVHTDRRYRAINLQNPSTVEFRIFKGTLKPEAFYASMILIDGLVRWCKQHTTPETHELTWDGLLGWINDPTLNGYWDTRKSCLGRYSEYTFSRCLLDYQRRIAA